MFVESDGKMIELRRGDTLSDSNKRVAPTGLAIPFWERIYKHDAPTELISI
jgi:hypothetical protein